LSNVKYPNVDDLILLAEPFTSVKTTIAPLRPLPSGVKTRPETETPAAVGVKTITVVAALLMPSDAMIVNPSGPLYPGSR
jgi:hypothetical protein